MKYLILLVIFIVGCTNNKEIIDYTNSNIEKFSTLNRYNSYKSNNLIAIYKRLDDKSIIIGITSKSRDSDIIIDSCRVGDSTVDIKEGYKNSDLPSWFNVYKLVLKDGYKPNDTLECKTNLENLSIKIF